MNEKRTLRIELEANIHPDELLAPYVAAALRDYVSAIAAGEMGCAEREHFRASNGVTLNITAHPETTPEMNPTIPQSMLDAVEFRHPENKELADALHGRSLLLRLSARPLNSTQTEKARVILHHLDGLLSALAA